MRELFSQTVSNLKANRLRSFLTMFGILWGIVSIVVLSAVGEGFRRGNDHVLREFGRNMAVVFPGLTSLQAGGERAGRLVILTADDARAVERESKLVRVVSAELERNLNLKSRYNASASNVAGIEPQYQEIRTIELSRGRNFNWEDERQARRVVILGHDVAQQLFGERDPLGEAITINGLPFTVVGRIRKKEQDSNYSGPDNRKAFVPFSAMARDFPRAVDPRAISRLIVAPHDWVVADLPNVLARRTGRVHDVVWPLEGEVRGILAKRHGFDPNDTSAIAVWDTSLNTLLFDRIIVYMKQFFTIVGFVTLTLGGIGVMNIMLIAVRERTREIGVRKALGATTRLVARQFFLEGFFLTMTSGGMGFLIAIGLCALVNLLPMPERFSGMIVTWQTGAAAVLTLALVGVVAATYPARRAAQMPPVEALRYEM
jgi:putative ABC transport system permease protein